MTLDYIDKALPLQKKSLPKEKLTLFKNFKSFVI